jgi:hypothetical protein
VRPAISLLILALGLPALARADSIEMEVAAEIAADGSEVRGWTRIRYTNEGEVPLDSLVLLLYPRRFVEPEAILNDLTTTRVYPGRFSPGGMELPDIEVQPVEFDLAPEGSYVRLPLEVPLEPGGTVQVELPFVTEVPRRYGTFGRYRWMVALNGGWTPQVAARAADGGWDLHAAPPSAAWSVDLTYDAGWGAVINGTVQGASEETAGAPGRGMAVFADGHARYEGRGRFVTVVLHRDPQVTVADSPQGPLTYVGAAPTELQRQDLSTVAERALGLLRAAGVPGAHEGTVVVEAPLRWRLVEQGEGCVLVSDRFLEADPNMRRTHQTQLARAVLTDRLLEQVERVEGAHEAPAIAEAVSWALVPRYLASRYRFNPTAQEVLRPLDFIPTIEQYLYAPMYPFADEVLNNPYQYDPLRADMRRFHRRGFSPRVSQLKIKEVVGPLAMDGAAVDYVTGLAEPTARRWFDVVEARTGIEVRSIWDAWERALPFVDYHLEVSRERGEEGWTTTIDVTRVAGAETPLPETVEVRATVPADGDEPRTRYELRWDGTGDSGSWQIQTDRRVRRVEIDPARKLLELDPQGFILRQDNQQPRRVKFNPWGYVYSLNVTEGTFEGVLGISGRTAFDNRNLISASGYHTEETTLGLGAGYYRYFGRSRDALYLRNRVGVSVGLDVLNQRFATVEGKLPVGAVATVGYRYDDRFGSTFPTRGGRVGVSVQTGNTWFAELDEGQFIGTGVSGSILFPIHPRLVLGWRGKAGATTADLPQMQMVLGGNSDLRGLPERFATGHFKLFTGIEWRYLALRDMDLRLPLGRLRAVEAVVFVEAGWVGNGAPTADEMHAGVGAGLRFDFAYFGIFPGIGGIDVAWSPRAPKGNLLPLPLQIYLVLGQSF